MYQLHHGMVMEEVVDLVVEQHLKTQTRKLQETEIGSQIQMVLHQTKDILAELDTLPVQGQIPKDLVEEVELVQQENQHRVVILTMEVVVQEKPQQSQDLT